MTTPRRLLKDLAKGKLPPQPLVVPIIFTLAAKVEAIPLRQFLTNPTKLANLLNRVYGGLQCDGIVAQYGNCLEAEALGCSLDWSEGQPTIRRPAQATTPPVPIDAAGLTRRGRIPIALDVVRRLRITLADRHALAVGLTGPATLAAQTGCSAELGGEILVKLAKQFCEAGADLVFVAEDAVPADLSRWQSLLSTAWNVIRFHQAVPALIAPGVPLDTLRAMAGECLICTDSAEWSADVPFGWMGRGRRPAGRCALITTPGEVPYSSDIRELKNLVASLRAL